MTRRRKRKASDPMTIGDTIVFGVIHNHQGITREFLARAIDRDIMEPDDIEESLQLGIAAGVVRDRGGRLYVAIWTPEDGNVFPDEHP